MPMRILFFIFCLCLMHACSPDEGTVAQAPFIEKFSCKIDNDDFESANILKSIRSGSITIQVQVGVEILQFQIIQSAVKGSHPMVFAGDYSAILINSSTNVSLEVSQGTMVVEKHDMDKKQLTASFSFQVKESGGSGSAEITEGELAIAY